MRILRSFLLVLTGLGLLITSAHAQSRLVSGRVVDEVNAAVAGASVLVKGTTTGTNTNAEGNFSISLPDGNQTLIVSSIGYQSVEVAVPRTMSEVAVRLSPDVKSLSEVVVTALGVQKSTRNVGYAVQQIGGGSIQEAREVNFINALQGKLAGVQIGGNSGSMGGSSRVTIRGLKSISGNNNALFIVDGVPMANMNLNSYGVRGGQGTGGGGFDYGNPAQLINPNDVENISVLKGAAATALYGSRGQNGVIYITTKSGKGSGNLSLNYDLNVQVDEVSYLPKFQNSYGGGGSSAFTKLYVNQNPSGFLPGGVPLTTTTAKENTILFPTTAPTNPGGPSWTVPWCATIGRGIKTVTILILVKRLPGVRILTTPRIFSKPELPFPITFRCPAAATKAQFVFRWGRPNKTSFIRVAS